MNTHKFPRVILQPDREKSLNRLHPWVFSKAIAQVVGRVNSGDTVDIVTADGQFIARGAFSPESQIRVRVWTFDPSQSIDHVFFKNRIGQLATRKMAFAANWTAANHQREGTSGYRLIAAEADGLPGVTVDHYGSVLVLQLLSAGAEKHREKIISALRYHFPSHRLYDRSDVNVRTKEGLVPSAGPIDSFDESTVEIHEGDIRIGVDVVNGHKTGFYLDQRDNRVQVARYCRDARVLNCFSYTGAFSLHALHAGAAHIINLDASQSALDHSIDNHQRNAAVLARNGQGAATYSHLKADVFEQLRSYQKEQQRFDVIILDPPKFMESKHQLKQAARGYQDINRLALECLTDDGILCTFSCSGNMPTDLFQKIVSDAALDANCHLTIEQSLVQSSDHTRASFYPEGLYLKGLIVRKRRFS